MDNVPTKEDRMRHLLSKIDARTKQIEVLKEGLKTKLDQIAFLEQRNQEDEVFLQEQRLLMDIRDGRLTVCRADSGEPVNIHVL